MRQTNLLPSPSVSRCTTSPCRLSPVPAGDWPFPTLSLRPMCRCSDPYPAVISGCLYPFLPRKHRPHLTGKRFGSRKSPCITASTGNRISRLQSFVYLRAPTLAWPSDCPHHDGSESTRQPGLLTPRIACPVAQDRMWLHYMTDMGNCHGWSLASWVAALSAAPSRIRFLDN